MNLPALVRFSQQDVYTSLTILGCTVNCRFRFADCPLIHCVYGHDFDEQHDAGINWSSIIFSKLVPIVANDTVDSSNGVIGCQKTFRIMLLPSLVLLANNDCAIDKTGSKKEFQQGQ